MSNPLGATLLNDVPPNAKSSKSAKDSSDDLGMPKITRNTRKPDLTQPLMSVYVGIGMSLAAFPNTRDDAAVIFQNAENAAKSVAKLADEKPEVRKVLEKFLQASAYAGVIAAHMPIIIGIMANHGISIMPAGMFTNGEETTSDAA